MSLIDEIIEKAKRNKKKIVLAEGTEQRIIEAARKICDNKIADIILIGDEGKVREAAGDISLSGIEIIDPRQNEKFEKFVSQLYEMRKEKGLTMDEARKMMSDELFFGSMLVKNNFADGMVAGSVHATSDVIRAGLVTIKAAEGIKTVSSFFLMEFPDKNLGDNGVLIYADCGFNIDPDEKQLAEIAVISARSAKAIANLDPKVAMLSFSTKGSAKHEKCDKVINATRIARELDPDLKIDGELQVDAAIVPKVAQMKAPQSEIKGEANVLIFPDLDSGNIAYKLTQRLAKATALGPVCQGFNKPVNDLSRGCTSDDVVGVVAITSLQAE